MAILNFYVYLYGCNTKEAEKRLNEYKSLQEFFTRKLKPGIRTIDPKAVLTSPVDGTIIHFGTLSNQNDQVEQVKGINYSLKEFVGENSPIYRHLPTLKKGSKLYYCVLYLAPGDYHGYHSPTNWQIENRRHFPGHLFPVNNKALTTCNGLFAFNERVVLTGKWQYGFFSMATIGAYNVGSINLLFDTELKTNDPGQIATSPFEEKSYDRAVELSKGDPMGSFNMGSSIVLIFEAPSMFFPFKRGKKIKLGERLVMGPYNSINESAKELKKFKEKVLRGSTDKIEDVANNLEVMKQKLSNQVNQITDNNEDFAKKNMQVIKQKLSEKIQKKFREKGSQNDNDKTD